MWGCAEVTLGTMTFGVQASITGSSIDTHFGVSLLLPCEILLVPFKVTT